MIKIYFKTTNWNIIRRIQERFNLPRCVTVNGETCQSCEVSAENLELLKETEKRGYIQIRPKQE